MIGSASDAKRAFRSQRVGVARWLRAAALSIALAGCEAADPATEASAPDEKPAPDDARREASRSPERPGRIILFSMDTVRAASVSGYANTDTTPNLEAIAAQGVRFSDFYAAATFTLPATMSIFTGLDALEHGLWNEAAVLSPEVPTLAELLGDAGYRTQAFHEGGYVGANFGFDRGFEQYYFYRQRKVVQESLWPILEWMRSAADEPYFLFLHTYAAHDPYGGFDRYRREHPERELPTRAEIDQFRIEFAMREIGVPTPAMTAPTEIRALCTLFNQLADDNAERLACGYNYLPASFPETPHFELDRAALVRGYEQRIRSIDRALGQIRALLTELDQWDDTLFVITSDHGEAFFEHGMYKHDQVPFDEVLRVPLILSYPRLLRERTVRVNTRLAWHLDLLPTILGLANVDYPGELRGVDLLARSKGAEPSETGRTIFPGVLRIPNEGMEPIRRVAVNHRFKLIEGHPKFGDGEGLLFDRQESPDERENLRTANPEVFDALTERTRRYESELEIRPAIHRETGQPITTTPGEFPATFELTPEEEKFLRALGYRD